MDTRWQLVAYVFVSISLRMVAAQLSRRRTEIAWVGSLSEGWAASVLRFVYYIGLPYVALILGVVPGRYLGLVGPGRLREPVSGPTPTLLARVRDHLSLAFLSWLPDVGTIVGLGVIVMLFLGVIWLGYAHLRRIVASGVRITPVSLRVRKDPGLVRVIYQAVHWSFYRSAVWLLTDDLYLGVVGGILLVGAEWMLDSGWVACVRRAQTRDVLLVDASVLVATSVIFFFVPNLWLLLPIHMLFATVCQRLVASGQGLMIGGRSGNFVHQLGE
jgi:hypothetical protein